MLFYTNAEFGLQENFISVIHVEHMSKVVKVEKHIKKAIERGCACYVLLTCSEPGADGKMQVEMNYEGDVDLAALLVQNAGQVFDGNKNLSK